MGFCTKTSFLSIREVIIKHGKVFHYETDAKYTAWESKECLPEKHFKVLNLASLLTSTKLKICGGSWKSMMLIKTRENTVMCGRVDQNICSEQTKPGLTGNAWPTEVILRSFELTFLIEQIFMFHKNTQSVYKSYCLIYWFFFVDMYIWWKW